MHQFLIRVLLAGAIAAFAGAVPAAAPVPASTLQLRWQLLRNVFTPDLPNGRSLARLTLTNAGSTALPSQGWGLYFNALEGIVPGPVSSGLVAEQLSGQLFRFRPGPAFTGLAPGAALDIDYYHPSIVMKTDKAPVGPYLAFDNLPESGVAIADYQIEVMTAPAQLDTGPGELTPLTTPQMLHARNAGTADLPASALPPVFPTPLLHERLPGSLRIASMPRIDALPALRNEAATARALFAAHAGPATAQSTVLRLRLAAIKGQASPEAYTLDIDPAKGIRITGATPAGVYRGLQSLRELLPLTASGPFDLAALRITDAPRFTYRGFQMDVARNFQSKETIFRLLDLMARYKLNKFHFHLTDDEGWRLAIAGLPALTTFGARRGHTLSVADHLQPAYGSGPSLDDAHGSGFYTRADYLAILRYAAARHIEVIPEIEMPGHARAAVMAMRSRCKSDTACLLNDPQDASVYTSPQLYNDHVLNPGMPGTYAFIERVVADIAAMHREAGVALHTIHVGGDELPTGAWEKSPASLAMMKKHGLATSADLWDYFYDRVDAILKKHGLFASGWEELGARKVTQDGQAKLVPNPAFARRGFNVYVWNNLGDAADLAYRLANAGYGTVLAPVTNMYFDMAYNKNPEEPGVHWGAYIELEDVYNFVPFDFAPQGKERLTDLGKANIRGLEATLFTETVRDVARMDYLIMPRMLALAERAWASAKDAKTGWTLFANQLGKRVLPRLDADGSGIAYRIAPPGLKRDGGRVLANHQLPGFTLRYTSDGSEPHAGSALVTGPIADKGVIRVAAFASNGRAGASSRMANP
ncbi:MAG: family 20 glycosylhydrolase [Pseudomonadota bacterium]